MELYVIPVSPNCRRTEAAVHHLDLDVRIVPVDMMSGENRQDKFLSLNPNGLVPTFVDGDFKLWESRAILLHLAGMKGDTSFLPTDPASKSDIMRWLFWEALHYNKAISTITWETVAKPMFGMGEPDDATVKAGLDEFNKFAPVLNDQLEGKAFITGDNVTVADFSVGNHSSLINFTGSQISLDAYPNIKAWHQRLDALPAWQATRPPFEQ